MMSARRATGWCREARVEGMLEGFGNLLDRVVTLAHEYMHVYYGVRLHTALEQAGLSDTNCPVSDEQPLGGVRRWSPRNSKYVEVRPIYTAIGFDYADLSNWSYRVRWYESGSTGETLVASAVEAVDLAVLKLGQARDQGCLLTC